METPTRHDFRIDAWKPDTLPMARFAKYLAKLAVIYGYEEHVHFVRVRKGSIIAETLIDYEATPKVVARLRSVGGPDAPPEADKAYQKINEMLREDNASAVLRIKKGAEIIRLPGRKTPLAEEIVLDEMSLSDVLDMLRAIEGSGWNSMDDPQKYLRKVRES